MGLRHYLVSGHVQGVGFRRYVEEQATHYGLSGIVRNLEDGRVECLAQGEDENLEEFERAVRRGSMLSAVRRVEATPVTEQRAVDAKWKTGLFSIALDGVKPWLKSHSKA